MQKAPIPADDTARIQTLRELDVLDTPPEERFDRITRMARRLLSTPIALVSLVDAHRQWFKSRQGLDATETPREISFCGHAILDDQVLVVPDAAEDERFSDNPLVACDPNIRFYAGYPLTAADGSRVGTLCVIDRKPRELSEDDLQLLRDLGAMVEQELAALSLATIDALTGLTNRRGFETHARPVLAIARRSKQPVSLVYVDLDLFKQVNDTFGHEAGDLLLCEFSRLLLDVFRDSDVIARMGGDEFCVLLSGACEEAAGTALARLEEARVAYNASSEHPWKLEFSAGFASCDRSEDPCLGDLVRRADARMYERKRERR